MSSPDPAHGARDAGSPRNESTAVPSGAPISQAPGQPADGVVETARCDYCGANRLVWRKCKLICESCGNINKSCADL